MRTGPVANLHITDDSTKRRSDKGGSGDWRQLVAEAQQDVFRAVNVKRPAFFGGIMQRNLVVGYLDS